MPSFCILAISVGRTNPSLAPEPLGPRRALHDAAGRGASHSGFGASGTFETILAFLQGNLAIVRVDRLR